MTLESQKQEWYSPRFSKRRTVDQLRARGRGIRLAAQRYVGLMTTGDAEENVDWDLRIGIQDERIPHYMHQPIEKLKSNGSN